MKLRECRLQTITVSLLSHPDLVQVEVEPRAIVEAVADPEEAVMVLVAVVPEEEVVVVEDDKQKSVFSYHFASEKKYPVNIIISSSYRIMM